MEIEINDVMIGGEFITVDYFRNEVEKSETIELESILSHIEYEGLNECTSDTENGGEHVQETITIDAYEYFMENQNEVLISYLKQK